MARVLIAYGSQRLGRDRSGNPRLDTHILSTVHDVEQALIAKGHRVDRVAVRRDVSRLLAHARRFKPDVVFNLCEQVNGEAALEKNVAAVFELIRVPYTGNDCLALALCLEKAKTKRFLNASGLATPDFAVVHAGENLEEFHLPAIVKPARADGSLGITARSVVKSKAALRRRIQYIHRAFKQPALVERFVAGREFQVSIMGNDQPRVLAVAELSYKGLPKHMPRICSWAAKWRQDSAYYRFTNPVLPARVSEKVRRYLEHAAMKTYRLLDLRGYARVDFRMGRTKPQIIDVNPNPDISADAGLARAARHAGMRYADLIDHIVELALERP